MILNCHFIQLFAVKRKKKTWIQAQMWEIKCWKSKRYSSRYQRADLNLVGHQLWKPTADLKINGRWNESHKAVNIYINQVTRPVFIPGILSPFSHILCHLIHKHGLQFHEMHRALMYLQYKHFPPSVEQSEQVHRAMWFTEQQRPRRGQRSRVERWVTSTTSTQDIGNVHRLW